MAAKTTDCSTIISHVKEWTVDDVSNYINGLEIDGHTFTLEEADNFRREAITGKLLLNLEKRDLNTLGVTQFSKRNALYTHIQSLNPDVSDCSHSANSHPITPSFSKYPQKRMMSSLSTTVHDQDPDLMVFHDIEDQMESDSETKPQGVSEQLNAVQMERVRDHEHLIEFPAIYQGANLHSKVFVLMTSEHIKALNALYAEFRTNAPNGPIRSQSSALQDFQCQIEAEKVPHGWIVGSAPNAVRFPFNTLVRCRLDLSRDEVVGIGLVTVSGHIKHVNDNGTVWVMGDVEMEAIEEVESGRNENPKMVSKIVAVRFRDISNTSLQGRNQDCSYMVHDPVDYGKARSAEVWRRGKRVNFNLKISTRTNPRVRTLRKPVFCQAWNATLL